MKKLALLIILIWSLHGNAQTDSPGEFIKLGVEDANKLTRAYIKPASDIIIFSLNRHYYTPFQTEKKFAVSVRLTALVTPEKFRTYDVEALNLQTVEPEDPAHRYGPTLTGDTIGVRLVSKKKSIFGQPAFAFVTPGGTGHPALALPYINLTYQARHTHVHLGFVPYIHLPVAKLNVFMLKAGVQQNLLKWWQILDPGRFDWSVNFNYGFMYAGRKLSVKPGLAYINASLNNQQSGDYDNQRLDINYHAWSIATAWAYKTEKWRFYTALAIGGGISTLKLRGTYPVYLSDPSGFFSIVATDLTDPLDITDTHFQVFNETGVRLDFKHFFLQLQGDLGTYTGGSLLTGYKF